MELKLDNDIILKERQAWNRTCLAAGIPTINEDTCARILACLYVHGNNEAFTFNGKFIADMEYIQNRFHIHGTGVPDADFVKSLQGYVRELEAYEATHKEMTDAVFSNAKPQWAKDLFMNMYGIRL